VADAIRYFFDEHLPDAVAYGLRAVGIDVLTVDEAGRGALPDDEQLRFATAEGRVMVTHDADYLTLAAQFLTTGELFSGVVYSHPTKYQGNVGGLIQALKLIHGAATPDEMLNHVEYL
jgi:hypothetical protein